MGTNPNKAKIKELAKDNLSFYIYDSEGIDKAAKTLRKAFPDVLFLYSLKTNPKREIIEMLVANGFGTDAASLGEVNYAVLAGLGQNMIYYSAPGKTQEMIEEGMKNSIVIADSLAELDRMELAAKKMGITAEIGLRINPNFTMDSDEGVSSKFGIDEDLIYENAEKILGYKNLKVKGIHVHSRSQELDHTILKRYYSRMFELCERLNSVLNTKLEFVNMGGGLGIPYNPDDKPLEVSKLGKEMCDIISEARKSLGDIKVIIETGRYIVGKNGTYVTTIVDKKVSHGRNYLILAATLNGFARPSLAKLVESQAQDMPKPSEPLYTKPGAFEFDVITDSIATEEVDVYGSLCTATDVIAKGVVLPKAEIGDLFTISNAGSYAAVLTPKQFASLEAVKEFMI